MSDQKISRSKDVVYRDLAAGENAVLLHVTSGAYHGLNGIGALIWSLIDGERTRDDIIREVREQVTDAPPTLADDVISFLDRLRNRHLIE